MSNITRMIWWWAGIVAISFFISNLWLGLAACFVYGMVTANYGFYALPFMYKRYKR